MVLNLADSPQPAAKPEPGVLFEELVNQGDCLLGKPWGVGNRTLNYSSVQFLVTLDVKWGL